MSAPYYGPRQASWEVRNAGGSTSVYNSREYALSDWTSSERAESLTRIEYCPHPDCDGTMLEVRVRGRMFAVRKSCPQWHLHPNPSLTIEVIRFFEGPLAGFEQWARGTEPGSVETGRPTEV